MEKNKKMMIVIIALLVILLAVIVGVSVFAFRMITNSGDNTPVEISYSDMQTELVALSSSVSANLLKGTDGISTHAAVVNLSVEVNVTDKEGEDVYARVEKSDAIIRDVVLTVLRDKTYEDMSHKDAKDIIKEEILVRLQDEFRTNLINNVYISEFYYN